jgi:hypothetical protein
MAEKPGIGASRGQVDGKFQARIDQLEERAKKMAEVFKDYMTNWRPWHTPDEIKTKELLDVPGMSFPSWDRNNINQIYSDSVFAGPEKQGGTTGDLIAMKWQADFMAVEERAWRTRHASYARCMAFMHGRLNGHGKQKVSVFSFFKDNVQTHIDAGKAGG